MMQSTNAQKTERYPSFTRSTNLLFCFWTFALALSLVTDSLAQVDSLVFLHRPTTTVRLDSLKEGLLSIIDEREQALVHIPLTECVRWGHLVASRTAEQVMLQDGSMLIGNVTRIRRDAINLETDLWGDLVLPRTVISSVVWSVPVNLVDRWKYRSILKNQQIESIELRNGDVVQGELLEGDVNTIQILPKGGMVDVNVDRVRAWVNTSARSTARTYRNRKK